MSMPSERLLISPQDALADLTQFDSIIDVRTPAEFAEDHFPSAINCPVLSDAERAEVGTMDRQQSSFEARRRGAALVARNIGRLIEERFNAMPRSWRPMVYCWRGGNRSAALAHVLMQVGWATRRLDGGYRAFRRSVLADLETLPPALSLRVISGPTGSGKSRLLRHLAEQGAQVIDLEALAEHRGSVLGAVPSSPQPSQRMFETRLWARLRALSAARPVFVEAESRKVGSVRVPDALLACMRAAPSVFIALPLDARVRLLRQEYEHFEIAPASLHEQLDRLTVLHGREEIKQWKVLADKQRWDELVERLLRHHYDPAYARSIARNYGEAAASLAIESEESAAFSAAARQLLEA